MRAAIAVPCRVCALRAFLVVHIRSANISDGEQLVGEAADTRVRAAFESVVSALRSKDVPFVCTVLIALAASATDAEWELVAEAATSAFAEHPHQPLVAFVSALRTDASWIALRRVELARAHIEIERQRRATN